MSATGLGIHETEFDLLLSPKNGVSHFYDSDQCMKYSIFQSEVRPCYCYSMSFVKLGSTVSGEDTVVYKYAGSFDHLMYLYADIKTPDFRLKAEYVDTHEFCLTHNLAQVVMPQGTIDIDGKEIQSIDTHYMMSDDAYLRKPNFDETYERNSGNIDELIQFSTSHKGGNVTPVHPFFMTKQSNQSLPLCRLPSQSVVSITYTFKGNVADIIRVRRRHGDTFEYLKLSADELKSMLDGFPGDGMLKVPDLYGCLSRISQDEKDVLSDPKEKYRDVSYYIESVVPFEDSDEKKWGQTARCTLKTSFPCKSIFVLTENVNSTSLNNRTNYSTDVNDLLKGDHPIEYIELMFGNVTKIRLPPHHFKGPLALVHYSSSPRRCGIYAIPFSYFVPSVGIDMGQLLGGLDAVIRVKFVSCPTSGSVDPSNTFIMHVRCLGIREIRFGWQTPFAMGV